MLTGKGSRGPQVDIWIMGILMYKLICREVTSNNSQVKAICTKLQKDEYMIPLRFRHVGRPFRYVLSCANSTTAAKDLISKILVACPQERAGWPDILADW